jgi:hypothetical protein
MDTTSQFFRSRPPPNKVAFLLHSKPTAAASFTTGRPSRLGVLFHADASDDDRRRRIRAPQVSRHDPNKSIEVGLGVIVC